MTYQRSETATSAAASTGCTWPKCYNISLWERQAAYTAAQEGQTRVVGPRSGGTDAMRFFFKFSCIVPGQRA
jgi:hypothetical protein